MKKLLFVAVIVVAASTFAFAATSQKSQHPVEMGGKDCVYCHAPGSTAENRSESLAYSQWTQSRHGINNVKCLTCHGSQNTFMPQSDLTICMSCHPQETTVIKRGSKGNSIICMNCHSAHTFPVTLEEKSVHK